MGRQSGDCDICGAPRIAKGLCWKHYQRRREGLPLEGPPRTQPVGEQSHNAKLTADNVREIRAMHADGYTLRELAAKFGVSNVSVYNAVARKTWKHLD
jgi:DNA invertase Pin-like site-specific DNA recombinase